MGTSNDFQFKSFPKIDLHRHLEGSLRVETLREIARQYAIPLPEGIDLTRLVQVQSNEPQTMANFLTKFQVLRQFYLSPEIIQRLAYEAVADAALDGICYVEIMFTPVAHNKMRGYPLDEVMDWVIEGSRQASRDYGINSRLIASVNRHENPDLAQEVALLAAKRREKGIVALNLAGNEAEFPADPFKQIFQEAHNNGLAVTIHAGEWNGANNVRQAIQEMKADRICHGVRIMEDPQVVQIAQQSQTLFEVCITSNLKSGVISSLHEHPLPKMQAAGLNVSLNTDDPGVQGSTLSDDFELAYQLLGLSISNLAQFTLNAARASFLPESEKEVLLANLKQKLSSYVS